MSISFFLLTALAWTTRAASPKATTLNGTYVGKNLPDWDQDAFLGIPYAQPPVGNLRFKWPQSLDSSFTEERTATEYGDSCMQYTQNWTMSEDCLSLNVIRPAGKPKKLLPVLYVSQTRNNPSRLIVGNTEFGFTAVVFTLAALLTHNTTLVGSSKSVKTSKSPS